MKRLWNYIKGLVTARYDAAVQWWGDRSWILSSVQDAHLDIDEATRTELVRKHRHFVANNPIVNRIRELKIQFAVGPSGLQCVPNSSDEVWNEAKAANFTDWSRTPEINTTLSMTECEQVWEGMLFETGEIFVHLTEKIIGKQVIPAIETIEGHRCATPPDKREEEGKTIIDGVAIDPVGQVRGFYIRDAIDKKKYQFIPRINPNTGAPEMLHKFKVLRPGQRRGIPDGFSGLNTLHDYVDLHNLEMKAAKAAGRVTNVVTTVTGEAPTPAKMRKQALNITTTDANGNAVTKTANDYYEVTQGGDTMYLRKGEDMKQFASNRPSAATQDYWDLKVAEICCGYNVPKLLVMPFSLQGTVTRADLDIAAGAFRKDFEIIASLVREIYEWQTIWAVRFDRRLDGKTPPDFLKVIIRPPRAPNVDIGRNSAAMLAELKAGTMTYQDIFAERQQDWRLQFRESAEAVYVLKKLAKEFSKDGVEITPEEIADKLDSGVADKTTPDAAAPKDAALSAATA